MESPLNPAIWKGLFNAALGTLSVASLVSIYHQQRDMQSVMYEPFRQLRAATTEEKKDAMLHDILARLQSDAMRKQQASRMSSVQYGACLVPLLKLEKDGGNAGSVSSALKVVLRVYGADAAGRRALHRCGGYKVLLGSLSEAHRQGSQELMEELAEGLKSLTQVDDSEVVLDTDVPEGAEGTNALARMPAVVKMLRILDPEGPVLFLNALTGIFANISTLNIGAVNVGRGTDGYSGISFFLRLLDHPNRSVVENCVMTIRFMVRAQIGQDELAKAENVTRLAENMHASSEPAVLYSLMTIILMMMGDEANRSTFLAHLCESTIPTTLFELWIRSPEKSLRNRAEVLCGALRRMAVTSGHMTVLFQRYAPQIEERRAKDAQEYQRQMQQMQQNQFMQRMMMEQMGMDPSMMG